MLSVVPITIKRARAHVAVHHSHLAPPVGALFAVAVAAAQPGRKVRWEFGPRAGASSERAKEMLRSAVQRGGRDEGTEQGSVSSGVGHAS